MNRKIRAVIKRPHQKPYVTNISNSLKNLQTHVGGAIETTTIAEECVIISNRDSVFSNMPYNCTVCGVQFFGPIIFVGASGDEFTDLPVAFEDFKKMFRGLWEK